MEDKQKFCAENSNSMAKTFREKNNQTLMEVWQRSAQSIDIVQKLTNFRMGKPTRKKRSWLLAGVMLSGLSLVETAIIGKHVRDLDDKFQKFCSRTVSIQRKELEFEEETIKIIGGLERKIKAVEEGLQCEIRQVANQLFIQQRINEFEGYISNLLDPIARNRMDGPATLKVLNKRMMKLIAEGPKLEGTIYQHNPELLTLGRLILVEASETGDAFDAHMVLALPKLKNETIYPLYKTHSVVFKSESKRCGKVMIAEYVTQKDGDWIKVELDKCQTRGQVKLCYALEEDKIQCLEKGEGCPIVGTSCRTDIKELPSGVLANTIQREVKGVKRGETALKVIPESGYYSYNVYKSLILDERVLFSLEHTQTEVMVSLPTTPAHLIYVEEEIADNPDLDRMRAMVKEHHDMIGEKLAPSMGSLTEICAWVGTGLWLIWGGYKLWAQMKWEQMSTAGRWMKSRIWRTLEEAEVEQPHQLQQQEMLPQQETLLQQEVEALKKKSVSFKL